MHLFQINSYLFEFLTLKGWKCTLFEDILLTINYKSMNTDSVRFLQCIHVWKGGKNRTNYKWTSLIVVHIYGYNCPLRVYVMYFAPSVVSIASYKYSFLHSIAQWSESVVPQWEISFLSKQHGDSCSIAVTVLVPPQQWMAVALVVV